MTIATVYWSKRDSKEMLAKGSDIPFLPDGLTERWVVNLYPDRRYQEILGFGAAFTEASAYNYSRLGRENQKKIVEAYFDKERGLGYNFCRTQIHSNDFSLDEYTYTDENDEALETFSIARDRKLIIPFIKAAKEAASDLRLFTSPWSPPRWMKDNKEFNNGGTGSRVRRLLGTVHSQVSGRVRQGGHRLLRPDRTERAVEPTDMGELPVHRRGGGGFRA